MIVRLTNVRAHVVAATGEEEAWLLSYLAVPDAKAKYRSPDAPAARPLYSRTSRSFPAGLLGLVIEDGRAAGVEVLVRDTRVVPCAPDPTADLRWLTDYQEEAVEHGYARQRGVFHMGTGSGKTEVMVALGAVLPTEHGVFVHRTSLLREIAERFQRRTGEEAGVIGDRRFAPRRFTVAMFQTVHRALRMGDKRVLAWLAKLGAVHVDEGHTLPSNTFWQVTVKAANAYWRWAYSATPFAREDQRGMLVVAATGTTLYRVKMRALVEAGIVAHGTVRMVGFAHSRGVSVRGIYADVYERLITHNAARLRVIGRLVARAQKPVLVFVRTIEHGRAVLDAVKAAGVEAEFVWGKHKVPVREAAVRRLEHGDVDALVCNTIFQEGVNIPTLASVVCTAGGKSAIAALQNAGRGSRRRDRAGGVAKEEFTVYDVADRACPRCGIVDADGVRLYDHKACEWFDRHSAARHAAYLSEGYTVLDDATGAPLPVAGAVSE